MRFGANHDEALALSGHQKDATPSKTETGVRIWSNAETGQEIWLPKDQAPTGQGWLPKSLAAERTGTEFERIKSQAMSFFGADNIDAAIGEISAWLMAKDTMMRWLENDADKAAEAMIRRWARGENITEEQIDAMIAAGPQGGGTEGDYAYEGVVE